MNSIKPTGVIKTNSEIKKVIGQGINTQSYFAQNNNSAEITGMLDPFSLINRRLNERDLERKLANADQSTKPSANTNKQEPESLTTSLVSSDDHTQAERNLGQINEQEITNIANNAIQSKEAETPIKEKDIRIGNENFTNSEVATYDINNFQLKLDDKSSIKASDGKYKIKDGVELSKDQLLKLIGGESVTVGDKTLLLERENLKIDGKLVEGFKLGDTKFGTSELTAGEHLTAGAMMGDFFQKNGQKVDSTLKAFQQLVNGKLPSDAYTLATIAGIHGKVNPGGDITPPRELSASFEKQLLTNYELRTNPELQDMGNMDEAKRLQLAKDTNKAQYAKTVENFSGIFREADDQARKTALQSLGFTGEDPRLQSRFGGSAVAASGELARRLTPQNDDTIPLLEQMQKILERYPDAKFIITSEVQGAATEAADSNGALKDSYRGTDQALATLASLEQLDSPTPPEGNVYRISANLVGIGHDGFTKALELQAGLAGHQAYQDLVKQGKIKHESHSTITTSHASTNGSYLGNANTSGSSDNGITMNDETNEIQARILAGGRVARLNYTNEGCQTQAVAEANTQAILDKTKDLMRGSGPESGDPKVPYAVTRSVAKENYAKSDEANLVSDDRVTRVTQTANGHLVLNSDFVNSSGVETEITEFNKQNAAQSTQPAAPAAPGAPTPTSTEKIDKQTSPPEKVPQPEKSQCVEDWMLAGARQ